MRTLIMLALGLQSLFAQEIVGPIRIHAGTSTFTDAAGQIWGPDTTFAQGSTAVSTSTAVVANATNQALYQSQRISYPTGTSCSPFSYLIPLPNARYRLTLKVAELTTASRSFSATFNGAALAQTITTQPGTATDLVYYLNVTSGSLNIAFSSTSIVTCALLSALEIVPQIAIQETDVSNLSTDLSNTVKKGPGFGTGAVAFVDTNGQLETVAGAPGTCVLIDGTTRNCIINYSDAETPQGTVDGANAVFHLSATPNPTQSLVLTRNGLVLAQGPDYTLNGAVITFTAAATPQPTDILQAFYRQ